MHLVVDQMVQLENVHVTHGDRPVEILAGASIEQRHLSRLGQAGELEHGLDFLFGCAIEHRRGERHPGLQVGREVDDLFVGQGAQVFGFAAGVVNQRQCLADVDDLRLRLEQFSDPFSKPLGRPAEVGLQDRSEERRVGKECA